MKVGELNYVTIIVSAIVSIFTTISVFIIKSWIEKRSYRSKLEMEFTYEQKKKIKEAISQNKIQLLNAAEALNHRLWNHSKNFDNNWQVVKGDYNNPEQRYFVASVYRYVAFFAWVRKNERDLIRLNTMLAEPDDLLFIQYLKLFPQLFCDTRLFSGFNYDINVAYDHFFRNDFNTMADSFCEEDGICEFPNYNSNLNYYSDSLYHIRSYLDGISPNETRLRWDLLQLFHISLIAFINSFGYKFQYTSKNKIQDLINSPRKSRLINNYIILLKDFNMDNSKEIKIIIKQIRQ